MIQHSRVMTIPPILSVRHRAPAAAGNGLLSALIAYWKMDEASGDALDAHTNGLTLTQIGSPGSDSGKINSARIFDGSSMAFGRTSEALLEMGDVDFTISLWATVADGSNYRWLLGKDTIAHREYGLLFNVEPNPQSFTFLANGGVVSWNGAVTLNTWYHIVAWNDSTAGTISIQVNGGSPISVSKGEVVTPWASVSFRIGAIDFVVPFWHYGKIDEVSMWKSAPGGGGVLTAAQRSTLWNAGNGLAYSQFTT